MMQVRPVGMSVHDLRVAVGVAVPHLGSEARVLVKVMAVVVPVAVDVLDLGVRVKVSMLTQDERRDRSDQQHADHRLTQSEGFAQQDERERRAEERSRGEDALSARSAELMGGGDVEPDGSWTGRGRFGTSAPRRASPSS